MDTLAPARTCCHTTFQVCTASATEFVDITEPLVAFTRMSGFVVGTVNIQTTHTTTGLIVNEHESAEESLEVLKQQRLVLVDDEAGGRVSGLDVHRTDHETRHAREGDERFGDVDELGG